MAGSDLPTTSSAGRRDGRLVVFANTGGRNIDGIESTPASASATSTSCSTWATGTATAAATCMTRQASTGAMLLPGRRRQGRFAAPVVAGEGLGPVALIAAVGDMTGDGYPDLMGQPSRRPMRIYPGNGGTGFREQLRRAHRDQLDRPGRRRPLGRRRRSRQPAAEARRLAAGVRRQRPGRPDRLQAGRLERQQATTGCSAPATSTATAAPTWWPAQKTNGWLWLLPGTDRLRRRGASGPGSASYDLGG